MSEASPTPADEPTPQPSAEHTPELLRRILATIEVSQRKRWVEIATAVVLALSTMASAWCAYQSSRWTGAQLFRLAEGAKAGREADNEEISAGESQTIDAVALFHFLEMREAGNTRLAQLMYNRFRPEAKVAVDAWLALDPFNNPTAPRGPFAMPQYVQPELAQAAQLRQVSDGLQVAAREASRLSDTYVLLTVLFSTVLFFGGTSATLSSESRRLRFSMHIIALVLFLSTFCYLLTLPVYKL